MRRGLWPTVLFILCLPNMATATEHDREIQQFFLPGSNTPGFRIHSARASLSHMNVTIPRGNIWAVGGYKTLVRFAHAPAASLTDFEIGLGQSGVLYQRFGYEGSVLGVTLSASGAVTTGTITARPTIRQTAAGLAAVVRATQLAVTLAATGPQQFASATQARGIDVFGSADEVGCRLTTSADLAPVTAQLLCTVVVEF